MRDVGSPGPARISRLALVALSVVACHANGPPDTTRSTSSAPSTEPSPAVTSPAVKAPAPSSTPAPAPTSERDADAIGAGFERLVMTMREAPCPTLARGDCVSAAEVHADGRFVLDPWGAPGEGPLQAKLTSEEVARVAVAAGAPELLALLDGAPPCEGADTSEKTRVAIGGTEHHRATGHCNDQAVQVVRRVALDLVRAHFPNHHLISPPF